MEDLWKVKDMDYRQSSVEDRAEYDRLVRRFHEEEEKANMKNLLYGKVRLRKSSEYGVE